MRRLPVVLAFLLVGLVAWGQSPVKIKPGDVLAVITANQPAYSGEFTVASDGSLSVQVLGQFVVAGKTLAEIQRVIERRIRDFVRDPVVTVILKTELPQFVYLVSPKVSNGAVAWTPGLDLRQVIANHPDLQPLDSYSATLFRAGKKLKTVDVESLLRQGSVEENTALEPGDVLTLIPAANRTVWVVGAVGRPGEVRLKEGESASQAIALAGGVSETRFSNQEILVLLRRGETQWQRSLTEVFSGEPWKLEAGDTLSVMLPREFQVTVGGFVRRAGELKLREGATVNEAVEAAGGPTDNGTLKRVLVLRNGEVLSVNVSALGSDTPSAAIALLNGDFIYVSENRRDYQVFGFVNRPGRRLLPDNRTIRLSDAIASAEGLAAKGTYRNTVVLRAGKDGKFVPYKFNLAKHMKDGDPSQNPIVEPGDIIFVDQTSGTTLNDLLRILPSVLLFDRFF